MSLQAYIVRRLIFLFFTLIGISLITFMLSRLAPGDPARLMAGMNASAEQVENIRARLGLDRPLSEQYLLYMRDLLSATWASRSSTVVRSPRICAISCRPPSS